MAQEQDKTQRWTAKRRAALVIEILRGDTSIQEAARQHGLTEYDDAYLELALREGVPLATLVARLEAAATLVGVARYQL